MNCSFGDDDAELDNVHVSTNDMLEFEILSLRSSWMFWSPGSPRGRRNCWRWRTTLWSSSSSISLRRRWGSTMVLGVLDVGLVVEKLNLTNSTDNAIISEYGWEISVLGVLLVLMSTSFHEVFSKSAWALHRSSEGTRERDTFEMIIIPSNNYGISPPKRTSTAIDLIDGFKQSFEIAACSPVKTDEEEPSFILFAFLRTPDDSYACRL